LQGLPLISAPQLLQKAMGISERYTHLKPELSAPPTGRR